MEKRVLGILIVFSIIILSASFLPAQLEDEEQKVIDGYACLRDNVREHCDDLSLEEKIFSVLASGECKSELIAKSSNTGECWPDGNCDVKKTAQAIFALENTGTGVAKAKQWLLDQNETPEELLWYLEVESSEPTTCTVEYSAGSYSFDMGEDRLLSNGAGPCLTLSSSSSYWLRIVPSCQDEEFRTSCDQQFLTTLLFRNSGSPTIHVSQESSSSAEGGTTTEKVESSCFANNDVCDYEGSLWSAFVLNSLGEDVSAHLPYLITLAEKNPKTLPDAFLYMITLSLQYRSSILANQKSSSWWAESGDEYYDTALALFPFKEEDITEKTNSKEWLLESQDSSGCWGGNNVIDTAFILASIWPIRSQPTDPETPDCESNGYNCVLSGNCDIGEELPEYDCSASYVCCLSDFVAPTCIELGGSICLSSEICSGGEDVSASGLSSGQTCCDGGSCQPRVQDSDCKVAGYLCKFDCDSGETSVDYACTSSADSCCKPRKGGGSFWIWFLIILIILVVVGIIFRDRLRDFWFRISSGGGSKPGPKPSSPPPMRREPIPERRILLPASRPAPRRRAPSRAEKELDGVLNKLKRMNK